MLGQAPFISTDRKQISVWEAGSWGGVTIRGGGVTIRGKGELWGMRKVLNLDCYGGYTGESICQNSSNCTLKWAFIICKLYFNKVE